MKAPVARGLARYGALSFCYFTAIGLFNPYAPLWFASLGFSTLAIGLIAALQSWTRVFAPYAWSWWGDHGGRRVELIRLAAAGALCSALALVAVQAIGGGAAAGAGMAAGTAAGMAAGMAAATAPWLAWAVACVTACMFLSNSGIVPLHEALVSQAVQGARGFDAARYGRVRVWGSVGFLVSVTAFGALLQGLGIGTFPLFVAAMNALLLAAALWLPASGARAVQAEPAPPVLPLLRQPQVAWLFASVFFTVLAHTSLYAFFSLYLDALGYGKAAVGALWAVSVAVEIVFFWRQGPWLARLSAHRWLELAAAVTALRFAATAGAGAAWAPLGLAVLVVAQLTHAVTFAAHHAACILLLARLFPGRLRGRGQALYTMLGYGLSGVAGGVGGGWLITRLGFAAVFWAAAGCALLAWACAWRARLAADEAG